LPIIDYFDIVTGGPDIKPHISMFKPGRLKTQSKEFYPGTLPGEYSA
jgi:hypothetical protein